MKILKKAPAPSCYPTTFYRTGKCEQDPRLFGGKIEPFDFEGKYYMSNMANKIQFDHSFNQYLMNSYEFYKNGEKGHFTYGKYRKLY
jgi:hypothetical protein